MRYLLFAISLIPTILISQNPIGGAGICHVNSDPNSILALQAQDARSTCQIAIDTNSGNVYRYENNRPVGSRWIIRYDSVGFFNNNNTVVTGRLQYSDDVGDFIFGGLGAVQLGTTSTHAWYVRNDTSIVLTKGMVVYASGTLGASGRMKVKPFIANRTIPTKYVVGILAADIPVGGDGYAIDIGKIRGINTNTLPEGTVLYASPTVVGGLTATEPVAPNPRMAIAFVLYEGNNGVLAVRLSDSETINDISDVNVTGATHNQVIKYDTLTKTWKSGNDLNGIYTSSGTISSGNNSLLTNTWNINYTNNSSAISLDNNSSNTNIILSSPDNSKSVFIDNSQTAIRGPLRFYGGNNNYVGFSAPSTVTSNYQLNLPQAAPTAGQVLTAGSTPLNLEWTTVSGGGVTSFSAGTTGLTPSTATTGVVTLGGTLNVASGGTGQTTLTQNSLLVGNGTSGVLSPSELVWDGTNKSLGINTTTRATTGLEVNGKIVSTTNTWIGTVTTMNQNSTDAVYGNGLFVSVAPSGTNRINYSVDGISWFAATVPESNNWNGVTYGNGLFVAVASSGTNRIATSIDGINWQVHPAPQQNEWSDVTYGKGIFVAVSRTGTNRAMSSKNGINWTLHTVTTSHPLQGVTFGDNRFVACASTGTGSKIFQSADGATWTIVVFSGTPTGEFKSVTYGNGFYVLAGTTGITRTNLVTYTLANSIGSFWNDVEYGEGVFVGVGSGTNKLVTSVDGLNWKVISLPANPDIRTLAYGNGLFVTLPETGNTSSFRSGSLQTHEPQTNNIYHGYTKFSNEVNSIKLSVNTLTNSSTNDALVIYNSDSTQLLSINNAGAFSIDSSYGTSGQVLTSQGSTSSPTWTNIPTYNDTMWINVKQLGAVGNGNTDDTDAFQTAIDSVNGGDKKRIFIPAGLYKITRPLKINGDYIYVVGETPSGTSSIPSNRSTIILYDPPSGGDTSACFTKNGWYFDMNNDRKGGMPTNTESVNGHYIFENLVIKALKANISCIQIVNAENVKLNNCQFQFKTRGVTLVTCFNSTISGCRFEGLYFNSGIGEGTLPISTAYKAWGLYAPGHCSINEIQAVGCGVGVYMPELQTTLIGARLEKNVHGLVLGDTILSTLNATHKTIKGFRGYIANVYGESNLRGVFMRRVLTPSVIEGIAMTSLGGGDWREAPYYTNSNAYGDYGYYLQDVHSSVQLNNFTASATSIGLYYRGGLINKSSAVVNNADISGGQTVQSTAPLTAFSNNPNTLGTAVINSQINDRNNVYTSDAQKKFRKQSYLPGLGITGLTDFNIRDPHVPTRNLGGEVYMASDDADSIIQVRFVGAHTSGQAAFNTITTGSLVSSTLPVGTYVYSSTLISETEETGVDTGTINIVNDTISVTAVQQKVEISFYGFSGSELVKRRIYRRKLGSPVFDGYFEIDGNVSTFTDNGQVVTGVNAGPPPAGFDIQGREELDINYKVLLTAHWNANAWVIPTSKTVNGFDIKVSDLPNIPCGGPGDCPSLPINWLIYR